MTQSPSVKPKSTKWTETMNEQYKSMQNNKVWKLVPLP